MTASEAWLPRIARRGKGPLPSRACFETALLAVDITGFTRLTDRLEREGEAGGEEVASLLNSRFGEVIDAVVSRGGDVLRFAGDALVAGWLYGGDERERLRLAVEAGLAIQAAVAKRQDGLELRCGVALGALRCLHLGESQRAFVASGPVLRDAHGAESLARPGNLVLAPSASLLLRGELEGATIEETYFRVDGLSLSPFRRLHRADPPDPTTATLPTTDDLFRSYLPKVVQERLAAGQADWLAELRPVTVAFLSLPLDPDDPALPDRVLRTCQQVVARYEGTIDKFLCDEKGTAILMAWGLPPWAHPDNPVRAVRACTELITALSSFLPGVCGGITTGVAFCGPVGNDKRREYTMIGSTVNLAARLMQASQKDRELLCDSATVNACRQRLTFDPRPAVMAKGFGEAIPVWRPNPQRLVSVVDLPPLIGRRQECEQLRAWLKETPSPDPSGRVMVVEGERGVGKGRVLSQAREEAEALGMQVLSAGSDAIEHNTPYFPWRRVVQQLAPDQDPELYLGLKEEISDLELLSARIRERVLQLLEPHARLLLMVEDAHEVDSASWGLLLHVVHSVKHLRVLTARRPDGRALPPKAEALLSDAPRLQLGPLDRAGTSALLCLRLNCSHVSEDLLEA
ncbi:MAG TPA: AAA family ATPase, partial [Myxococcota bacterium]|nr:AAA family ATPase [Myxococcota bacterium]